MARFKVILLFIAVLSLALAGLFGYGETVTAEAAEPVDYLSVAPAADGLGTEAEPYIPDAAVPQALRGAAFLRFIDEGLDSSSFSDIYFELDQDFNLADIAGFVPIGKGRVNSFAGIFNGNGFSISNLSIASADQFTGLFSVLAEAQVFDLNLANFTVSSTASYTGVLAGAAGVSELSDITVSASVVHGSHFLGGVAGIANDSVISGVSVLNLTATAGLNAGGAFGVLVSSEATDVTVEELNLTASDAVGGVFGRVAASEIEYATFRSGTLNAQASAGGIAGFCEGGSMSLSRSAGTLTAANKLGGLIGEAALSAPLFIENCYSISALSKSPSGTMFNYIGGLIGYFTTSQVNYLRIADCYFSGSLFAPNIESYGGIFGVSIRLTNPNTTYVSAESCYYNESCFVSLTSRPFPSSSESDKISYKNIYDNRARLIASYQGFDFDDVWVIDTNASSGFGKYPDFARYHSVHKIRLITGDGSPAAQQFPYVGLMPGQDYNVVDGGSFVVNFTPKSGYFVETLTLELGDDETQNSINLVHQPRADAVFSNNTLTVSNITEDGTVAFVIDSDDYNYIVTSRYYIGESTDYMGLVSPTGSWVLENNRYYTSLKYDDSFVLRYNSGEITLVDEGGTPRKVANIYRLSKLYYGGIELTNLNALKGLGSTELSGTLIFTVADFAALAVDYIRLRETDPVPSYIFIELVWEARECAVIVNPPILDGTGGSQDGCGTVQITGNAFPGKYYMGETITFKAIPGKKDDGTDGYVFAGWQKNTGSGYVMLDSPAEFSITLGPDADRIDLTARFRALWDLTFTVTPGGAAHILNTKYGLDTYLTGDFHILNYSALVAEMATLDPAAAAALFESAKIPHSASGFILKLPNLIAVNYYLFPESDMVGALSYGGIMTPSTISAGSGYSTVTVSFTPVSYTLTLSVENSAYGTAVIDGGVTVFVKDSVAIVTVSSTARYRFSHWLRVPQTGQGEIFNSVTSGGNLFDESFSGTTYTCKIKVTSNLQLRAIFVRWSSVTLSLQKTSGKVAASLGSYDIQSQTKVVPPGSDVTFELRVYEGFSIKSAKINQQSVVGEFPSSGSGVENVGGVMMKYQSHTYTMRNVSGDPTIEVFFEISSYNVEVSSANTAYGTVSGGGIYTHEIKANLVAAPKEGYRFVGWLMDANPIYNPDGSLSNENVYWSTIAQVEWTVNKAAKFIALFEKIPTVSAIKYSVSLTPQEGTKGCGIYLGNNPLGKTATIETGKSVTVRMEPLNGWTFVGWYPLGYDQSTPAVSVNKSYTFVLMSDVALVPVCTQDVYTVTIVETNCIITVEGRNPTISGGNKVLNCVYGENLVFVATPNSGYALSGWVKNGIVFSTKSLKHPVGITDNLTISAVIESAGGATPPTDENKAVVTIVSNDYAMGTTTGGGLVTLGESKTISAIAREGYTFLYWVDQENRIVSRSPNFTIIASGDVSYSAVFEKETNKIIKTTNTGGRIIAPDGIVYQEEVSVTIRPDRGYTIRDIRVNGNYIDIGAIAEGAEYTLTLIGDGHDQTVTVVYERTGVTAWIIGIVSGAAALLAVGIGLIVSARRRKFTKTQ